MTTKNDLIADESELIEWISFGNFSKKECSKIYEAMLKYQVFKNSREMARLTSLCESKPWWKIW